MTISITTFANQAGPIPLSQLDTNFANVAAAIDALQTTANFTPGVAFGGSSAGITYGFRTGTYFKILNLVFFTLDLLLSSKGAAAGALTITGLPFPISLAFPVNSVPITSVACRNMDFSDGLAGFLVAGTTTMNILNLVAAGNFTLISNIESANNTEIIVTGFYATP